MPSVIFLCKFETASMLHMFLCIINMLCISFSMNIQERRVCVEYKVYNTFLRVRVNMLCSSLSLNIHEGRVCVDYAVYNTFLCVNLVCMTSLLRRIWDATAKAINWPTNENNSMLR